MLCHFCNIFHIMVWVTYSKCTKTMTEFLRIWVTHLWYLDRVVQAAHIVHLSQHSSTEHGFWIFVCDPVTKITGIRTSYILTHIKVSLLNSAVSILDILKYHDTCTCNDTDTLWYCDILYILNFDNVNLSTPLVSKRSTVSHRYRRCFDIVDPFDPVNIYWHCTIFTGFPTRSGHGNHAQ